MMGLATPPISHMEDVMTVQLTVIGILFVFGVLLLFKALPPNRWFGLRTVRTLADAAVWYRAHRALGWVFLVTSLVAGGLGFWPNTPAHPAWELGGVLVVTTAFVLVYRRYAT
jgi:uncharacterized membrane protein